VENGDAQHRGMKDMMIYIQLPLKPSPACGWP
jgi:hypothetical protein